MIIRARGILPVSRPPLDDGALIVAEGRVQAVGRWAELRRHQAGPAEDLGSVLVLPGLVNAHCHLDYTDMAGLLPPPRAFSDWIKGLIALKAAWSYSEYAQSWLKGARSLLTHGTTTVADIEAVPELLPEVTQATPLRVNTCLELINVRSWNSAGALVREAELKLQSLDGTALGLGLSPHAPYSTSPDLLRQAAACARRHHWLLTSHLAESREEFDMFTRRRGALFDLLQSQRDVSVCGRGSPVRFVAGQGILGREFLAAHVNYLEEGDAGLLGAAGASVVHCPRSHAFFRHGRFPLAALSGAGVNLCLGTDSLASVGGAKGRKPELDLFAEMRALAAREPELSAENIVRMATVNGAQALGLAGQVGVLAAGSRADLIAIPIEGRPGDPFESVLGHEGPVRGSMIGGRWVVPPAS